MLALMANGYLVDPILLIRADSSSEQLADQAISLLGHAIHLQME